MATAAISRCWATVSTRRPSSPLWSARRQRLFASRPQLQQGPPAPPARGRAPAATPAVMAAAATKGGKSGATRQRRQLYVSLEPDGSDLWRLDPVIDALREGAVGIIPTDTNPAFVCDVANKDAVQRLFELKGIPASRQLSILCRGLQDVDTYTLGWPAANSPGQPDMFKLVRRILPGPYTFILHASKQLPKQITNYTSGRSKARSTVGVRLPDDDICQTILAGLDRPLLCSSAKVAGSEDAAPEAAVLLDTYGPRGLNFVVDAGPRPSQDSTIIDATGAEPVLVRQGKGEASFFLQE